VKNSLPTGTLTFLFTDVEGSTRTLADVDAPLRMIGLIGVQRPISKRLKVRSATTRTVTEVANRI
jgi:hypothetical protein